MRKGNIPSLDAINTRTSTILDSHWPQIVRQVNDEGVVAITTGSKIDAVLVCLDTYQRLSKLTSDANMDEYPDFEERSRLFRDQMELLNSK